MCAVIRLLQYELRRCHLNRELEALAPRPELSHVDHIHDPGLHLARRTVGRANDRSHHDVTGGDRLRDGDCIKSWEKREKGIIIGVPRTAREFGNAYLN